LVNERIKKAFLGKARHNLKNPVNAIIGYSEMLLEDCEESGNENLLIDLNSLLLAGNEILNHIENQLSDNRINKIEHSVVQMGKDAEIAIRTPLNTIIGVSELLLEDEFDHIVSTFSSDMKNINDSGQMLIQELKSIIDFKISDLEEIRNQNLNVGNLSMVKDVLDSIQPLESADYKKMVIGQILVVDDNINNTELLKKRLEKQGHEIIIANNGREALIHLMTKDKSLDLMLLDIVMPEMNGYEVLKFIRNDKRFHELPVIMISSMDDTDSIYRCIEIGADDYIQKPFNQAVLNARISSCIERKQLRDKEITLISKLNIEREKSENLLLNMLPNSVASRLKAGERDIATKHDEVTVVFADIVEFTPQTQEMNPSMVVHILNNIFTSFDKLAQQFNVEKIKTIGDSYFAVGGLNSNNQKQSAINVIEMAKEMLNVLVILNKETKEMKLVLRIGVHTGPAVSGVIGRNKFAYDVWGATINMANRLETTCVNGKIHISKKTKELLGSRYSYIKCKDTEIKGIGLKTTYIIK